MSSEVLLSSRFRLKTTFTRDGAVFDPQIVLFNARFEPATKGLRPTNINHQYGVGIGITRMSTGIYYVELYPSQLGKYRYAWRSTLTNEEVTVEDIVIVKPRTVV